MTHRVVVLSHYRVVRKLAVLVRKLEHVHERRRLVLDSDLARAVVGRRWRARGGWARDVRAGVRRVS